MAMATGSERCAAARAARWRSGAPRAIRAPTPSGSAEDSSTSPSDNRMSTTTTTHSFTLFVQGVDVLSDASVDALHAAGCDDATFGARDGAQYAAFDREAPSFGEAIASAIDDVTRALPALEVVHVAPDDLVSMATIAKRAGRSREYIRLLATERRGPGGFPPPVAYVDDKTRVWHWPDVAHWLVEHGKANVHVDPEAADLVATLNAAFDVREHSGRLPEPALALVAAAIGRVLDK